MAYKLEKEQMELLKALLKFTQRGKIIQLHEKFAIGKCEILILIIVKFQTNL